MSHVSARPRLALAALLAAAVARPAAAQLGSGTVNFTFTGFSGPIATSTEADSRTPALWGSSGLVNDATPTPTGVWLPRSPAPSFDGYVLGTHAFAGPTTSATLRYTFEAATSPFANVISFAARPFSNVAVGQEFVLGTLTFQNGAWFGSGSTPVLNVPTDLGFRITTTSASGAAFNQTIVGGVRMVVNSPDGNDPFTTRAGQEAEADWVHLTGPAVLAGAGAFRVFDTCCRPAGSTSFGRVNVIARFGSLDLVRFVNARDGFITPGVGALPSVPPGPGTVVPEPATWALLAAGLAALGASGARRARRARRARTAT